MLFLPGFVLFLFLFVLPFAVIHDAADGGRTLGGDLDQVETTVAGHHLGLSGTDNANLFVVLINDPHLWDTDLLIQPKILAGDCCQPTFLDLVQFLTLRASLFLSQS